MPFSSHFYDNPAFIVTGYDRDFEDSNLFSEQLERRRIGLSPQSDPIMTLHSKLRMAFALMADATTLPVHSLLSRALTKS
jgi:hypothetical protein